MAETTLAGALLAIGCVGCLSAPFQPPTGVVTACSDPLTTECNVKHGSKTGSSEAISILGLVAVGDCSLNAAIKQGKLKEAYYADYKYLNILGIFQKVTVNVVGE